MVKSVCSGKIDKPASNGSNTTFVTNVGTKWEFLFLGANQDAIATAARMGIHAHNSATFAANDEDLQASNLAFACKVSAKRREASQCNLAEGEAAFAHESMTESLEKSRKDKR